MLGIQELLMLSIVIIVLTATGMWPVIIRGLRELRGERFDDEPAPRTSNASASDLDMCYRMLGLAPSASKDEIERAYKRKAKIHHPDLGGDEDMMRALNEAYNRLKRAQKK